MVRLLELGFELQELFYLKARNFSGNWLLSHLRSCFDSWACANHILRSHKPMGFSSHIPHCAGFITPVEVLVTVRSNIYYLSLSLLDHQRSGTSKREWKLFIFLPPLSSFYENMYSKNAKRVLRKPARETHAPIERLGSKRNQYGDGLLTTQSTCVVNWI